MAVMAAHEGAAPDKRRAEANADPRQVGADARDRRSHGRQAGDGVASRQMACPPNRLHERRHGQQRPGRSGQARQEAAGGSPPPALRSQGEEGGHGEAPGDGLGVGEHEDEGHCGGERQKL